MDNNKIILSSLALDLRRVAQGYFRGSHKMADKFYAEALMRKREAEAWEQQLYIRRLLKKVEELHTEKDEKKRAEDALMYSTLFQNAALRL